MRIFFSYVINVLFKMYYLCTLHIFLLRINNFNVITIIIISVACLSTEGSIHKQSNQLLNFLVIMQVYFHKT